MTASWEMRWFVTGDIDAALRPAGRGVRRTDAYHLDSLSPDSSLKRRDRNGPLESKTRIGAARRLEVRGVPAIAERWAKRRVRKRDVHPLLGPWIQVRKQLWRPADVEICRLDLDGETWWTIAVPVIDDRPSKAARKVIVAWADLLVTDGHASSYPMWLRARWDEQSTTSSEEAQAS